MDNYKMFFKHQKFTATNDLFKFLTQYGVISFVDFILLEYLFNAYKKELTDTDSFFKHSSERFTSSLDEGDKEFFFIPLSEILKQNPIYEYFINDEMILAKLSYFASLWILEYQVKENSVFLRFSDEAFMLFSDYQRGKDAV